MGTWKMVRRGHSKRGTIKSFGNGALLFGLDDTTFAQVVTAGFMQISSIMMMPEFLGPRFNAIVDPPLWLGRSLSAPFVAYKTLPEAKSQEMVSSVTIPAATTKKRRRNKKKSA